MLFGDNDIKVVLDRLDRLTPEEAQMTAVQTLMVVHGLFENLRQVMSGERILLYSVCHVLSAKHGSLKTG